MNLFDSLSGLVNKLTGTGTPEDKITYASWYFEKPADDQLMRLYRSTWIARKMIDIPIDDMLRQGWSWQAEDSDITLLEEEEKRLGIREKIRQVLTRDSIYGGGALIIGDGSENPDQPLLPEQIGKQGLEYVIVSGRGELIVKKFHDAPSIEYRKPEMYELMTMNGKSIQVHPSRVIPLIGQPIESPFSVMQEPDFWGDSRLATVMRDIAAAMAGVAGTGRLMEELAVTYYKMAGFTEKMAERDGEETISRMLGLISRMKSSVHPVGMDVEDEVQVITANFAGLPETVRSLMQNVAGAADIPLTRFLGSSPDGLNATGASDVRNYYDRLAGRRAAYVEPGVAYLDKFLIRSALGRDSKDAWRVWNPLWQLSETEQVDVDAKKIKIMTDLAAAGVVHDHVVEQVARTMLIDSPTFQGAETAFKEADEMPEPDPEEVAAATTLAAPSSGQPPARNLLRVAGGTDFGDMAPSPLYVRRDVLNRREIFEWARGQGFTDLLPASDLGVTVLFSEQPVDWFKMGGAWEGNLEIGPGGPRLVEQFGESIALRFHSDELLWRHERMIEAGASHDYSEYSPHIVISRSKQSVDIAAVEPYRGRIVLGPEIFERADGDWEGKDE